MRDDMPLPRHIIDEQSYVDMMDELEILEAQQEWLDTLGVWAVGVGCSALGAVVGFLFGWLGMN